MQNNSDSNPLLTNEVKEACRVLLDHIRLCEVETFYFTADYFTPATQEQGRVVIYAAKGQQASALENVVNQSMLEA